MNENYTQNVEVEVTSKARKMQWLGIICILLGVGFILLAIFLSLYWLIAVAAFIAIGAIYIHFYNDTPTEFFYSISSERIVIAKKDVVNRTRRMLSVMLKDVTQFGAMQDLLDRSDILAAGNVNSDGVYQLVFKQGDGYGRLLFSPDEYMRVLIEQRLDDITAEKVKNMEIAEITSENNGSQESNETPVSLDGSDDTDGSWAVKK